MNDGRLGLLGLAKRKGSVRIGSEETLKSIQSSNYALIVLASDAGDNLRKKIHDKAGTYKLPLLTDIDSETLSRALGGKNIKVCAVEDRNLIKSLVG